MPHRSAIVLSLIAAGAVAVLAAPPSRADNSRFNRSVVSNVYTVQRQAGCTNSLTISPQLQLAAQWHTDDVLNNRNLDGDSGSDGSTPQDRARAAGYTGKVTETVAINPALAISGMELINMWYNDSGDLAIMRDCANTQIGVWSENSLDRTVVVAVYGQPTSDTGVRVPPTSGAQEAAPDLSPDYDGSGEIQYFFSWLPWILRGVYPPPAYPAQ
jgi:uncharacterized protein YkwD